MVLRLPPLLVDGKQTQCRLLVRLVGNRKATAIVIQFAENYEPFAVFFLCNVKLALDGFRIRQLHRVGCMPSGLVVLIEQPAALGNPCKLLICWSNCLLAFRLGYHGERQRHDDGRHNYWRE